MEGKPVSPEQFKKISSETLTEDTLTVIYSGLFSLLRRAIRLPLTSLKPEVRTQVSFRKGGKPRIYC